MLPVTGEKDLRSAEDERTLVNRKIRQESARQLLGRLLHLDVVDVALALHSVDDLEQAHLAVESRRHEQVFTRMEAEIGEHGGVLIPVVCVRQLFEHQFIRLEGACLAEHLLV